METHFRFRLADNGFWNPLSFYEHDTYKKGIFAAVVKMSSSYQSIDEGPAMALEFTVSGLTTRRFELLYYTNGIARAFDSSAEVDEVCAEIKSIFLRDFPTQVSALPHPIMGYELEASEFTRSEARAFEKRARGLYLLADRAVQVFESVVYDHLGKQDASAFWHYLNNTDGDGFSGEFVL